MKTTILWQISKTNLQVWASSQHEQSLWSRSSGLSLKVQMSSSSDSHLFHWNQIYRETCPFHICQFKFARSMHPDYCRHVTVSSSRRQLYDKVFSRYKVKITRGTRQWQDVAQAQKPTRWLALRGGKLLLLLDWTFEWNINKCISPSPCYAQSDGILSEIYS